MLMAPNDSKSPLTIPQKGSTLEPDVLSSHHHPQQTVSSRVATEGQLLHQAAEESRWFMFRGHLA